MRNLIIDLDLKMLQLATACDGVHTSKMNCSLRLIFFFSFSVSVRQTEVEKILPQLSTQLARLLFPCSLSPVTSTETAAKYICRRRRRSRV